MTNVCTTNLNFIFNSLVTGLAPSPVRSTAQASYIGKSTPDSNWFGTKLECIPNWQASKLGGNTCWSLHLGPDAVYPQLVFQFKLVTSLLDTRHTIFCELTMTFVDRV